MDGETEMIEVSDNAGVRTIALRRPERRNAMNLAMAREVHAALEDLTGVAAVIVTGDDRAFSAGADLKEGGGSDQPGTNWFHAMDRLSSLTIPTVAAIEGHCLGGGLELAMCCDLRVAGEAAGLGLPEVRHGVFPAGGGTQRLPRLVGEGRARWLLLTGRTIDGATAERWGLVQLLVPTGEALATAEALATEVAGHPRPAVEAIKHLLAHGADVPLERGLQLERDTLRWLTGRAGT
jgi:enoyl-CoA hydratase/carnithine racemase